MGKEEKNRKACIRKHRRIIDWHKGDVPVRSVGLCLCVNSPPAVICHVDQSPWVEGGEIVMIRPARSTTNPPLTRWQIIHAAEHRGNPSKVGSNIVQSNIHQNHFKHCHWQTYYTQRLHDLKKKTHTRKTPRYMVIRWPLRVSHDWAHWPQLRVVREAVHLLKFETMWMVPQL